MSRRIKRVPKRHPMINIFPFTEGRDYTVIDQINQRITISPAQLGEFVRALQMVLTRGQGQPSYMIDTKGELTQNV